MPARRDSVQSLERAFDLLEALAAGGELGVTELATRTGLVPSTAHRLLHTLIKRGYVIQSTESGRYLLGYKVVEVASGLEHRLERLRVVARPHLEGIQRATGETVNLVVLDADRVVYVDQVEGSRNVRMFTAVGSSVPAHTTGSGKVMMAHSPPEAVAALYADREPLERLTPRTLVTIEALEDDFTRIRRRGYALDNEEHEEGVGCVATAVFDHTGRPCAAISVSGPTARILHARTSELARAADRARRPGVRRARPPGRRGRLISPGGPARACRAGARSAPTARARGRRRRSRRSAPGARRGSRRLRLASISSDVMIIRCWRSRRLSYSPVTIGLPAAVTKIVWNSRSTATKPSASPASAYASCCAIAFDSSAAIAGAGPPATTLSSANRSTSMRVSITASTSATETGTTSAPRFG